MDAAGTSVMGHGIYYKENVASGEPLSYNCLKVDYCNCITKLLSVNLMYDIFVRLKIHLHWSHGFGTYVYQSYPEYEKQGAYLTTEIIFRVVKKVLTERKLLTFRNLYVHLDNYSVNKNFTIISAMGALTILGSLDNYLCMHLLWSF